MRIAIAYVIQRLGGGGAERQLLELVKGIDRKKFDPVVIYYRELSTWDEWNISEYKRLGIPIIRLRQRFTLDPILIFNIYKLLKEKRVLIVHCWAFNSNFHGRIAAKINHTPVIIASSRGKDLRQSRFPKAIAVMIDRALSKITDLLITNCKAGMQLLWEKGIDRSKVKCIYNGVDLTRFCSYANRDSIRRELDIRPSEKVVGFIGRLVPVKDPKMLLSAAVEVLAEIQDTKFLIIGDGPLRKELELFSRRLGIESNILFLADRQDIPKLLLAFDISVLPSIWENCSNAILETMAMGRPIVAFNVGGNPEIISNGQTGFLVTKREKTHLARTIIDALEDTDCLIKMGNLAKDEIRKKFSVDRMVKEVERTYHTLLYKRR